MFVVFSLFRNNSICANICKKKRADDSKCCGTDSISKIMYAAKSCKHRHIETAAYVPREGTLLNN